MRELVGTCELCGDDVFCEDGFFNGVHKGGNIYCHQCVGQGEDVER